MRHKSRVARLRVHFIYEYETMPEFYPEDQRDALAMARFDLDRSHIIDADEGHIERAEVVRTDELK